MSTQGLISSEPAAPVRSHRDLRTSLLLGLLCLLVYNANLRVISAGDAYPARYLPFGIWRYHTLALDPISTITAQGRSKTAFWIVRIPGGHAVSFYPIVTPVLVAPLYLPAVVYLHARAWEPRRLERIARIMEKLSASLLAATSVALFYLLLRRRAGSASALLLTLAFAFGTNTWVISSQALWQHGLAELLIVATLLLLTGPCTTRAALAAGLLCGLIACNRPPDSILAAALGIYGLWWARRLAPLLVASATLPVGLALVYNLWAVGHVLGGYGFVFNASFFRYDLLSGVAGLLVSPTRGLFVFCPFLLFLPFCLPQALRDRSTRGLTVAAGAAMAVLVLLYAKADWRQGFSWGPRYLTDTLPLLLWMMTPGVSILRGAGRLAFVSACGVAIVIQAIGAFWYTGTSDPPIYAVAAGPNETRAAWDLRNIPFIVELRHARAPAELLTDVRGSLDAMTTRDGAARQVATGKEIELAGWALAGNHTPREAIVLLDGQRVASTGSFLARPDVTRALGASDPSGWLLTVPTRDLAVGEHVLAVVVRAFEGGDLIFLTERRFTVLASPNAEAGRL
jgi:hypothetical protein